MDGGVNEHIHMERTRKETANKQGKQQNLSWCTGLPVQVAAGAPELVPLLCDVLPWHQAEELLRGKASCIYDVLRPLQQPYAEKRLFGGYCK